MSIFRQLSKKIRASIYLISLECLNALKIDTISKEKSLIKPTEVPLCRLLIKEAQDASAKNNLTNLPNFNITDWLTSHYHCKFRHQRMLVIGFCFGIVSLDKLRQVLLKNSLRIGASVLVRLRKAEFRALILGS